MADITTIKIIDLDPVTEFLPGLLTLYSDNLGNTKKATVQQLRDFFNNAPLLINPTVSTPANGDNSLKIANTQYVQSALSGLGLGNATATQPGTVRTNTTDPAPVVYLKSEIDTLNNTVRSIATGGTGGNSDITARTALNAAGNGINNDITALNALASIPALIQAAINAVYKPGMFMYTTSPNIPAGWLHCSGAAVSRTIYAGLFAEIGTMYGIGDGSTTFNLPKVNGRSVMGDGVSDNGSNRLLGVRLGNEYNILSIANLPSHSHGGLTAGADRNIDHLHSSTVSQEGLHAHNTDSAGASTTAVGGFASRVTGGGGTGVFSVGSAGQHNHTITVGAADRSLDHLHGIPAQGSGQAFDITNPGIVFRPIIKT